MPYFLLTAIFAIALTHPRKSSRSHVFFKIVILKNFAILTGKHLCWSIFLFKLQACIKKRLQHSYFPVNITKFFREALFIEHLRWLLLLMPKIEKKY